jgi:chemotaxis methyl-accepting protein methylase
MKKIIGIILLILYSLNTLSAQKPQMKYGKPDKADLEMKVYASDSSASAVLLCNYGYFDSNNLQFVHQMRIKILKDEGKAHGNFWVPAAEKTNVKGQTVNLENVVPVVTKLTKDGIFIEKVTKYVYRARVAMPNVKVGSVIDVEFYYQGLPSF